MVTNSALCWIQLFIEGEGRGPKSIHWYQKYLHKRKGGKVMTATNMCSNFGGFRCSPQGTLTTCVQSPGKDTTTKKTSICQHALALEVIRGICLDGAGSLLR